MDAISRINTKLTGSQQQEVTSGEKDQKNPAGIAETSDQFELSHRGSRSELLTPPSAQAAVEPSNLAVNPGAGEAVRMPDRTAGTGNTALARPPDSGANAFSITGANELLGQTLEVLKAEKQGLTSRIIEKSAELVGLELSWKEQWAKVHSMGGKGGGVDGSTKLNEAMQRIKALESELANLKSQLANIDAEIKKTMEQIDKLESA